MPEIKPKLEAGRPAERLRWTMARAASEFDINPRTVSKRVKVAGILPGSDGKFSTAEIHAAICGDYERERTRKMKEDADSAVIRNAKERAELIDVADFIKRFEGIYSSMRDRIMGSAMTDAEKDQVLADLARLHSL